MATFAASLSLRRWRQHAFQNLSSTKRLRCFSTEPDRQLNVTLLKGDDEGVAVLGLNRPSAKNALGTKLVYELRDAISSFRNNGRIRCTILKSDVPSVFCAGADLKERSKMNPEEVHSFVYTLRSTFSELAALPMPTIAAIDGAAVGGGLELALACDLRIAAEGSALGLPETSLAIIPGAGGTQRLPRLIGIAKAKELIFTAKRLNASEALSIGLVNYATESGKAYQKALEVARQISANGPIALRMAKLAINQGIEVDLRSGLSFEETCYAQVIPTQDRLEGIQAFMEKRKPVYKGQ